MAVRPHPQLTYDDYAAISHDGLRRDDVYEPLLHTLDGWKATAEAYADPRLVEVINKPHRGPAVKLRRPSSSGARTR